MTESLTALEQQILDQLQYTEPQLMADGKNWCRVICLVKCAAAIVACGGNPALIAVAVASGLACVRDCENKGT